jgi:hypothetical protein
MNIKLENMTKNDLTLVQSSNKRGSFGRVYTKLYKLMILL